MMTLEQIRRLAQQALDRAEKDASDLEKSAKDNPFNGWAVHSAVEKRGYAQGYKAAMEMVLGMLSES